MIKSAATITIRRAADMSPKGRKAIANWMRRQARFLEKKADKLAARFTARYMY